MGTYNLPRNVKGEGRILFIFSTKALIYTIVGIGIGMTLIGVIIIALFGLIGFSLGTFKVPNSNAFKITKEAGGENLDDVIKRYIKFKISKNKIYTYQKQEIAEENKQEETKED